jgi:hypothetical protein
MEKAIKNRNGEAGLGQNQNYMEQADLLVNLNFLAGAIITPLKV